MLPDLRKPERRILRADPAFPVLGMGIYRVGTREIRQRCYRRKTVFHVPELARDTTHPQLATTAADGNNGAFDLESPEPGWRLKLICSDGTEAPDVVDWQWEHVSVHAFRGGTVEHHVHHDFLVGDRPYTSGRAPQIRTPTWKEMSYIKRLCWDAEDVVVQFHPRESEYVNCHPNVLHLWRPKLQAIPTPPAILVGPVSQKEVTT